MERRLRRVGLLLLSAYASWLLMMAVHESGHVLNAWLSGGHVARVRFGLFELSETELSKNPHPQFVDWGGPVWGCLIPLAILALARGWRRVPKRYSCFFAGLCLIANGAYIGIGWVDGAGDAGTLLREGVPRWLMVLVGLLTLAAGLYLWHRLGPRLGLITSPGTDG
ncbi:MAG TPA: hypothetical protein VHY91_02350 [Pirellulales bacterium]|jgi:hypothetical protein|nr:hypothetical protein [Pirellulales bacterium]